MPDMTEHEATSMTEHEAAYQIAHNSCRAITTFAQAVGVLAHWHDGPWRESYGVLGRGMVAAYYPVWLERQRAWWRSGGRMRAAVLKAAASAMFIAAACRVATLVREYKEAE